ncbi:MAG: hypothetical protein RMM17_09495 [Acidobacteriota bacterium]|nr:hypothetical protein [Blastocatellia bacterium]MDW8412903.1 hypothetical protein [Acidobacteriota bacterium]
MQELILKESGVPFVRPTLVFGKEDILVNNIAWLIRKSPVFLIFESENYRIQPVYVGDLAEIAICQSTIDSGTTMDATRPETFTFREFVEFIVQKVGSKTVFIKTPSSVGIFCGKILGLFLRDVLLTYDELKGLMDKMLTSTQVPKMTRISDWLAENKAMVGSTYSSEIVRRFRWSPT